MDHPYEEVDVEIRDGEGKSLFQGTTGDIQRAASRMKETAEDEAVRDGVSAATRCRLRSFIERLEGLEEEKKEIAAQIKDVFAEAKGEGFDTTAIRKLIRMRKQDPDDRAEEQAVLELYMAALGMS